MSRTAYTPCDWPECDRSPANGHMLFRVNPKGQKGVFMCQEHAGPDADEVAEVWKAVAMHTDLPLGREGQ